jgi:hypothetical protein
MATTSGLINSVVITASEFITDALEDLRVLPDGGTPTSGDLTKGLRKLNMLVKKFAIEGMLLWVRDLIQIPEVQNKFRYTIGPTGDVVTYRPLRALPGAYIRQVCGQNPVSDVPLNLLSRLEYLQMSQKGATGVTNSFYYDPQMAPSPFSAYDPSQSNGVLYVWTAPADSTRAIFLDVHRPIQDITDVTQGLDIPLEWYDTISLALQMMLADAYEIPEARITRKKKEGMEAIKALADWGAQEQAPMSFQPDWRWGSAMRRGRF